MELCRFWGNGKFTPLAAGVGPRGSLPPLPAEPALVLPALPALVAPPAPLWLGAAPLAPAIG